ncbi:6-phosphogluconate dehydrogenase C-terminal domain-like protein [Exidia glandulosa HHB12029]|uniref:6-phosphogluconate dehydrogenase C-terminal domain-like protein n=1 Tax=Exidia glandulosa HHB12029 TaxID=1314781 RepID=A0A165G4X3_EXIGL|nr:6-phosphogluconate dehydrogenase C-terminal domain-like protein [Exidia glandulosa HHB12029]
MRIHVVGPGAIGSLLAFHLKRATTHSVVLHPRMKPQTLVDLSKRETAIQIFSPGSSQVEVTSGLELEYPGDSTSQKPIDALVVTTKAQHAKRAIEELAPRLSRLSTLFLLCNGLPSIIPAVTQDIFPRDTRPSFIVGHTSHGVHRVDAPVVQESTVCHGTWKHAGMGRVVCAVWSDSDAEDTANKERQDSPSLITMKSALLACRALDVTFIDYKDWQTTALAKLAVNCAVNAASALIGTTNASLLSPTAYPFLSAVLQEVAAVFAAEAEAEGLDGHHDVLAHEHLLKTTLDMIASTQNNVSSTLADVRRVQAAAEPEPYTELAHMNGWISTLGRKHGIITPLNDALPALVETKCQALAKGL